LSIVWNYNGIREEKYKCAVLATRERNYYDDSDFYAIVWDEEKQCVHDVEYATTRFGGGGDAWVDATPEVIEKAKAYFAPIIAHDLITDSQNEYDKRVKEFKSFHTGTIVKVKRTIKTRKQGIIPEGFTGVLVWKGPGYSYHAPPQYGVKNPETGQCVFVSENDLKYAGPEPTPEDIPLPLTDADYDNLLAKVTEAYKTVKTYYLGRTYAALNPKGCVVM
jgi:hypothetical protein